MRPGSQSFPFGMLPSNSSIGKTKPYVLQGQGLWVFAQPPSIWHKIAAAHQMHLEARCIHNGANNVTLTLCVHRTLGFRAHATPTSCLWHAQVCSNCFEFMLQLKDVCEPE